MTGDGMCGVFIPDRVLAGKWRSQWKASDRLGAGRCTAGCGRGSLAFHWLLHLPARTLSGINTPHIPSPVILHPPAYEDGTGRIFRNVGY